MEDSKKNENTLKFFLDKKKKNLVKIFLLNYGIVC